MSSPESQHNNGQDLRPEARQLPEFRGGDRFQIYDERSANWVVRKIVECRAYRAKVDAWAAAEKTRAQREESFFLRAYEPQLREWAAKEIQKLRGRRKFVALPAGTLAFRRGKPKLVIDSEKAVISCGLGRFRRLITMVTGHVLSEEED